MDKGIPSYSIVIPVYNEEETIHELYTRLTSVMNKTGEEYEIIFVNDKSTDSSLGIICSLRGKDDRVKCVSLARNFGHQLSISSGMFYSAGQAVIVMDGDLQDPPEVIPSLIKKWKEGNEVVYAVRTKRKENIVKKFFYKVFYKVLKKVSYLDIPLDSGDFSLMDRKVIDLLNSMPEKNRFVRGIRTWVGFKQIGVEYERDRRFAGSSKYSLGKLINLAMDGIFSFSYRPLKFVTSMGLFISLLSFLGGLYYFLAFIIKGDAPRGFYTIAILILFMAGVQLVVLGIMGDYIGRIHEEVKGRPMFVVGQLIGLAPRE